ncbi:MAG: Primosomal protein N' [Firmicutes bacterium ADurb.Bin182]|nr:MAG: Primosomal protein N' [Firmicutes bacterium ADurb.Bin182]
MFAQVIIDISHSKLDRTFTYAVPEGMSVQRGHRVLVPFGRGSKPVEGFVLSLTNEPPQDVMVKQILKTMEPYTVLSDEQLELALWISRSYHCVLVEALRLMIPAQLRGSRVKEKRVRTVILNPQADPKIMRESLLKKDGSPRSAAQLEIFDLLQRTGAEMTVSDIVSYIPGAQPAVASLIKKGIVLEKGREIFRRPYSGSVLQDEPLELTGPQSRALDTICSGLNAGSGVFLLHGVTGSGKTEIYMQGIKKCVNAGGTAIMLVPEIALTPQTVDRFRARFGEKIAVLHSRLSAGERYDEWRRIRLGRVSVAVGARSAVFAPLSNIKLIIIDEEHENSYQSESVPRYHAMEVAIKRCALNKAALVLGSATPSLSTYHKALKGSFRLIELNERIMSRPLPKVEVVDMRTEFLSGNLAIFSRVLHKRLQECFDEGKQAILFLNRRGYSTFVSCRGCGYVFKCPDCDVSMTYHKAEKRLKCHYCGNSAPVPEVCPECRQRYIKYFGIGTQQVEEQMKELFPGIKTLRMDMDTTRTKNAHNELLSSFIEGKAQVLIGTQMIAKGLDIPGVTLVGVVAADASLYIPDYRSSERTFQLITQVAGRAGRDDSPGRVVVQTYSPDHPAIQYASGHDYKGFYRFESAQRRAALFPPYSLFVRILFTGPDEAELEHEAGKVNEDIGRIMLETLREMGADPVEMLLNVSSPAPMRRRQGLFRHQILIKLLRTKNTSALLLKLYAYLDVNSTANLYSLEVNPGEMI